MITIWGKGFALVKAVTFGGIKAKFYENLSLGKLSVKVPAGARSGAIAVVTAAGTVLSPIPLRVR
jgi:hypothetical protein